GLAPDERARLLDETRAELVELTNLVAELVELAADVRSEEPIEALDLARIAEDVAARFRRRSGRPVTVSLEGTPAAVEGRAGMVGRAISNLVDNALKFSPPESGVEIEVDGAGVRVLDRGPGIDPAERPRVFDRFFRASTARTAPGSGLGLAIVRQIAEVHGGRASVSDREGGGTVATLELVLPVRRA
ncbi:MAG: sensor histidine kinase, partial [Acidimicrobiales bacterium]